GDLAAELIDSRQVHGAGRQRDAHVSLTEDLVLDRVVPHTATQNVTGGLIHSGGLCGDTFSDNTENNPFCCAKESNTAHSARVVGLGVTGVGEAQGLVRKDLTEVDPVGSAIAVDGRGGSGVDVAVVTLKRQHGVGGLYRQWAIVDPAARAVNQRHSPALAGPDAHISAQVGLHGSNLFTRGHGSYLIRLVKDRQGAAAGSDQGELVDATNRSAVSGCIDGSRAISDVG